MQNIRAQFFGAHWLSDEREPSGFRDSNKQSFNGIWNSRMYLNAVFELWKFIEISIYIEWLPISAPREIYHKI